MILNRKSAKQTSRVSLGIALTMLTIMISGLAAQDFQVAQYGEQGVQICRVGLLELLTGVAL